ncbi:hypothetical protein LNQ82_07050 [Conchiformibius steedae DSM 2580]|uniref:Uncharacterized protein n=1 Tax=Conchiformibius steedae DSM 2580 TaxID=1121352 RepID=A0AAE9HXK7_9NEIS|nr:hypothetical protein [Conchiformibius steedae]QMT34186.1 hypothetical protein H3L98_04135 [Conchiformibius steedae]URD66961.1 hypothetical protein LNQ82_07050 [Conchiformibius steedae DSM 2580]
MMQKIIDGNRHTWQNNCVALNQAIGFDSLNNVASKPPQRASAFKTTEYRSGISYACNPPVLPFYGKQGRKALRLLVSRCQSVNPPFVSRLAFDSVSAGLLNQREKADSMNPTASIGVSVRRPRAVRKGFSNPLCLHTLRIFPTFSQASRFTQQRLHRRPDYRLAIQQTAADTWAVCRVIGGAV